MILLESLSVWAPIKRTTAKEQRGRLASGLYSRIKVVKDSRIALIAACVRRRFTVPLRVAIKSILHSIIYVLGLNCRPSPASSSGAVAAQRRPRGVDPRDRPPSLLLHQLCVFSGAGDVEAPGLAHGRLLGPARRYAKQSPYSRVQAGTGRAGPRRRHVAPGPPKGAGTYLRRAGAFRPSSEPSTLRSLPRDQGPDGV
jgi:hypothetical protein